MPSSGAVTLVSVSPVPPSFARTSTSTAAPALTAAASPIATGPAARVLPTSPIVTAAGMRAEGGEIEVERQVARPRHRADVDRHDVRRRQVELAVRGQPRDEDAGGEEHRPVGLQIQQVVRLRQAERAQHGRTRRGITQRDLERVAGMPRILEKLAAKDREGQRRLRRRQGEGLVQRGKLVAAFSERRAVRGGGDRAGDGPGEPGRRRVGDGERAVGQRP